MVSIAKQAVIPTGNGNYIATYAGDNITTLRREGSNQLTSVTTQQLVEFMKEFGPRRNIHTDRFELGPKRPINGQTGLPMTIKEHATWLKNYGNVCI